jgi:AAA15 family ATPase/GTPase
MAKRTTKKTVKTPAKKTLAQSANSNHISRLEIKNFKSIKHMKIEPKRINLFIGKPNVGKSNILEAISLLGGYYSSRLNDNEKYLSDLIRYQDFDELYYDRFTGESIEVITDIFYSIIVARNQAQYCYITAKNEDVLSFLNLNYSAADIRNDFSTYKANLFASDDSLYPTPTCQFISNSGRIDLQDISVSGKNPFKKFEFVKQESFPNRHHQFLLPPNGNNLYTVIKQNVKLRQDISKIFKEYKLDLVLRSQQPILELQKKVKGIITSYNYSGIADTLQRYIFHLSAIRSNIDSIMLFEEPEAHNFPAYIRQLAEDIIAEERNQYFITTHSPFILNVILENVKFNDLNIYRVYYERYETKVELLSDEVLSEMLNYGSDIFFKV